MTYIEIIDFISRWKCDKQLERYSKNEIKLGFSTRAEFCVLCNLLYVYWNYCSDKNRKSICFFFVFVCPNYWHWVHYVIEDHSMDCVKAKNDDENNDNMMKIIINRREHYNDCPLLGHPSIHIHLYVQPIVPCPHRSIEYKSIWFLLLMFFCHWNFAVFDFIIV